MQPPRTNGHWTVQFDTGSHILWLERQPVVWQVVLKTGISSGCYFWPSVSIPEGGGLDTKQLSNSKVHHPVGSRCRSSDGAELELSRWIEIEMRCNRKFCYSCRRQRQPRFFDRDRPEKSNPSRCRMSPKMHGVGKCAFSPGPSITIINKGHFTAIINKKAVLPQGNRAMPQVFFSVEVRQQHSLQA